MEKAGEELGERAARIRNIPGEARLRAMRAKRLEGQLMPEERAAKAGFRAAKTAAFMGGEFYVSLIPFMPILIIPLILGVVVVAIFFIFFVIWLTLYSLTGG